MRRRILSAVLGLTLLGSGIALAQSGYLQTFDGTPPAPAPYPAVAPLAAWDVTVHSRDAQAGTVLEQMDASHGPDCSAPPAVHHTTGAYADSVYACSNHIMTAMLDGGYGVIYLTPPVVADWTDTPAVIQWDMSTARTSQRDWVDLWLSPFDEHLQLPLEGWLPDLNGYPRHAVTLRMENFNNQTVFIANTIAEFVGAGVPMNWWTYESFFTPSAARRDTFQLTVSRTHLKFGMPAYNFWWVDSDIPDLGWTSGVVQFGHHSYNPGKDCPEGQLCGPNTWHWDNVSVNPSLPFTITRAVQERADATTPTIAFPRPAVTGERLRFNGVGDAYEVSFNNSGVWQPATLQPAELSHPDKARNYWMGVPAGTQTVTFRAQTGWWGWWGVRDVSLWSQVQVPPSQRTPTPTLTGPTRTPTPPPTLTPGPTATDLPTPTSLPTITPAPTGAPIATATPGPRCGRVDEINGGLVWTPLPASQCFQ